MVQTWQRCDMLQADLSCRNTKTQVGAVYTRTNFVTLKYVTDAWGTDSNGFKLTITAVKDPSKYSNTNSIVWRSGLGGHIPADNAISS
jgi:hypothetical protein